MGRTNLALQTVRNPVQLSRALLIKQKLDEHDTTLDLLLAAAGVSVPDPTEVFTTIVRSITHDAADDVVKGTKTFTFANGAFTAADVGRRLCLTATAGGTNDLVYTIASVTNGTTIVTTEAPGGDETSGATVWVAKILSKVRSISHDAADSVVASTKAWLFTNGAFAASDVGRKLEIRGAAAAGNNKTYTIATVVDGTHITTTEAPAANETFGGGVTQRVLESQAILDVTKKLCLVDGRGTIAAILPDATRIGQELYIRMYTAGVLTPAVTITPTHMTDSLVTILLNAAEEQVRLVWTADGWRVMSFSGATLA